MKPLDFPLLADANIPRGVVTALRTRGYDIVSAHDRGLAVADDEAILRGATKEGRVVVTQDADFGTLVVRQGLPHVGIVYLRPGHLRLQPILSAFDALASSEEETEPPFVAVVEHRGDVVRVRIRRRPVAE